MIKTKINPALTFVLINDEIQHNILKTCFNSKKFLSPLLTKNKSFLQGIRWIKIKLVPTDK